MKPINWTKDDEKRAAKMGWFVVPDEMMGGVICKGSNRFKSDAEAARWVVDALWETSFETAPARARWDTCQKAVLICCGGAR